MRRLPGEPVELAACRQVPEATSQEQREQLGKQLVGQVARHLALTARKPHTAAGDKLRYNNPRNCRVGDAWRGFREVVKDTGRSGNDGGKAATKTTSNIISQSTKGRAATKTASNSISLSTRGSYSAPRDHSINI